MEVTIEETRRAFEIVEYIKELVGEYIGSIDIYYIEYDKNIINFSVEKVSCGSSYIDSYSIPIEILLNRSSWNGYMAKCKEEAEIRRIEQEKIVAEQKKRYEIEKSRRILQQYGIAVINETISSCDFAVLQKLYNSITYVKICVGLTREDCQAQLDKFVWNNKVLQPGDTIYIELGGKQYRTILIHGNKEHYLVCCITWKVVFVIQHDVLVAYEHRLTMNSLNALLEYEGGYCVQ